MLVGAQGPTPPDGAAKGGAPPYGVASPLAHFGFPPDFGYVLEKLGLWALFRPISRIFLEQIF